MNQCRVCSEGFKISMYFFVAISALGTVVVSALLAVYLVRAALPMPCVQARFGDAVQSRITAVRQAASIHQDFSGGSCRTRIGHVVLNANPQSYVILVTGKGNKHMRYT